MAENFQFKVSKIFSLIDQLLPQTIVWILFTSVWTKLAKAQCTFNQEMESEILHKEKSLNFDEKDKKPVGSDKQGSLIMDQIMSHSRGR